MCSGEVFSVAFHPTKPNMLASGSDDKTTKIWDIDNGKCESTLSGHSNGYVFFSSLLLLIRVLISRNYRVTSVAWSMDGTLASGSWDNSVKIWVMDSSNKLKLQSTLTGHSD